MDTIATVCEKDPAILLATAYQVIDLENETSIQQGTDWWLSLTAAGGEGMVVKPWNYVESNAKGLVQPAIKVRGREYLRIIYGPEYTLPEHMNRLKNRGLHGKRSLALRSLRWEWKGWRDFNRRCHCEKSTNACSGCWRWKANRLIPGSDL